MVLNDYYMWTTEGQRNWTAACERETEARFNWNSKWGWMPSVMAEQTNKLKELKNRQFERELKDHLSVEKKHARDPRPYPQSTNHEYGWLATKPEYQIERYGEFPLTMKVRVIPTAEEIKQEKTRENLERVLRAKEEKKRAKLDRLMAEKNVANVDDYERESNDLSINNSGDVEENGSS